MDDHWLSSLRRLMTTSTGGSMVTSRGWSERSTAISSSGRLNRIRHPPLRSSPPTDDHLDERGRGCRAASRLTDGRLRWRCSTSRTTSPQCSSALSRTTSPSSGPHSRRVEDRECALVSNSKRVIRTTSGPSILPRVHRCPPDHPLTPPPDQRVAVRASSSRWARAHRRMQHSAYDSTTSSGSGRRECARSCLRVEGVDPERPRGDPKQYSLARS